MWNSVTCYVLKTEFDITYQDLATLIGCKSHCTALYYVRTCQGRYDTDKKYKKNYNQLLKILKDERLVPIVEETQSNTKRVLSPVLS